MVPVLSDRSAAIDTALRLGAHPQALNVNLTALQDLDGQPCAAGSDSFYIGIDGDIYPCSRYYVLGRNRLGNVLDPQFELPLRADRWEACQARFGCCNKEDFLNLKAWRQDHEPDAPSLGWVGDRRDEHAR